MVQFHIPNYQPTHSLAEFEFLQDPKDSASKLGTGSFGAVKLAREKTSGKLFAFKIVELTKITETDLHNLKSEILIHSELNHPNIIKFHGYIHEENLVYIILDYASHGNLYNYLQCKKRLTEKEVFRFFHQSCLAANYLHQKNILHRDIKPENLLLDDDFNIKVCDFGWAAHNINQQRSTFCGTYEYMAPEIIREETYNYRVDIWALGVLLFELIHNRPPYEGRTLPEIKTSLKRNQLTFDDKIREDLRILIFRTLDFNPNNRIALDQVLSSSWITEHVERELNFRKSVYQGEIIGRATRFQNVSQKLKIFDDEPETQSQPQPQPQPRPQLQSPPHPQLQNQPQNEPEPENQTYDYQSKTQLKAIDINAYHNPFSQSHSKAHVHLIEDEPVKISTSRRVSKIISQYSVPTDFSSNPGTTTNKQSASSLAILLQEGIITDATHLPQPSKKVAGKRRIFDENILSPVFGQQIDKVMGTLNSRYQTEYMSPRKETFNYTTQQNQSMRQKTEYGPLKGPQSFAQEALSPSQTFTRSLAEFFAPKEGLVSAGGSPRVRFHQESSLPTKTEPKKKTSDEEGFSFSALFENFNFLSSCSKGHVN